MVIMDFSGVYSEESFWKEEHICWIEAQDIDSTNCYCDNEAEEELIKRIKSFSGEEIHFLDSGNYHYMTGIWLKKIKKPFQLLVLDNHTDMQLPAFGGILSCGGWIADSLEHLELLKQVFLAGPCKEDWDAVENEFQEKTVFLSREELEKKESSEAVLEFFRRLEPGLPLYISIDKDILSQEEVRTGWSQGTMTLEELEKVLLVLFDQLKEKEIPLLGVDICGEGERDDQTGAEMNDRVNKRLLRLLKEKGVFHEE